MAIKLSSVETLSVYSGHVFGLIFFFVCFEGVVGACGISVLCNLMRLYHFTQTCGDRENDDSRQRLPLSGSPLRKWRRAGQFWCLVMLLSLVGPRVSSLIVLEFCLRAVSAWASAGLVSSPTMGLNLLLIQCQFSLGCSLTCILDFLHQGALHSSLSLLLAAALSWMLASVVDSLWVHVAQLYQLHSTQRNCGKCITLLTSGHAILASLQSVVILAFALGIVASTNTVSDHFLSHKDALKFWTPLTLCYTVLLFYIQEEQNQQTGLEALLHYVALRLGALLVLMLMVGEWTDVLHVLIAFLGEAACVLPSQDLLQSESNFTTRERQRKPSPEDGQ
uniref:Transmembrane protein 82 n=1 Tax=Takifugu rubripes TaxID=31033 RepID=A0A674NHK4_TAKRU